MEILISGAGIAGLTVAYWLRRYGFTPTVVERAPSLLTGGYKIDVRGTALQVLRRMGIHDAVITASTDMQKGGWRWPLRWNKRSNGLVTV
jgi:2-polyprenyl-6-methoxyphenol hydroxylase-like FAD-dependent oxidoreductase